MAKKKAAKVVDTQEETTVLPVEVTVDKVETPVLKEDKVVEDAPVAFHDNEVPALEELEAAKKEVEAELNASTVSVPTEAPSAPELPSVEAPELPSTEVWEENTHIQFEKWANGGNYEIRFKGAVIYDSLNPCGVVAFYPAFVKIGHRRFQYNLVQLVRK